MLVYADTAATTQLSNAAAEAMRPILFDSLCGNPSSTHRFGQWASALLDTARMEIAECINAYPDEIYFTSGGTEADNWAVKIGDFNNYKNERHLSLVSEIEHKAVSYSADMVLKHVGHVPVNEDGVLEPRDLEMALGDNVGFVSVMLANNEIGTIQPVKELAGMHRNMSRLFHTDAVQAVGHIPVDVKELGVDMLSASAHKFHGPRGVGFLYVRRGVPMIPLIYGGGQEHGMRSGTENVPGIVGMAAALKESVVNMEENAERVTKMRDDLIDGLLDITGVSVNGLYADRLPGIVSVCVDGVLGESLVLMLSQKGINVSSGSACTSGDLSPSHVLKAIGKSDEEARSGLRISIDEYNSEKDITYILETVPKCISFLRGIS